MSERGDSGQGEAERTNSATGDALADRATIDREFDKIFTDMTDEEVNCMILQEYEIHKGKKAR